LGSGKTVEKGLQRQKDTERRKVGSSFKGKKKRKKKESNRTATTVKSCEEQTDISRKWKKRKKRQWKEWLQRKEKKSCRLVKKDVRGKGNQTQEKGQGGGARAPQGENKNTKGDEKSRAQGRDIRTSWKSKIKVKPIREKEMIQPLSRIGMHVIDRERSVTGQTNLDC